MNFRNEYVFAQRVRGEPGRYQYTQKMACKPRVKEIELANREQAGLNFPIPFFRWQGGYLGGMVHGSDFRTQRRIVFSVAFAAFMAKLDSSILNISLPDIAQYFNVTTSQVSQVSLIYMMVLTCTLLPFGKLAGRWGLKKLFICGYALFVLGSLLCGVSWTLSMLVASRLIQGIGGSMLFISAFSIIPRYLPADRTGWAFGLLSTAAALAITLGGPLGGLITGLVSWHWIFLINVPMGIIAIVFASHHLPCDSPQHEEKKTAFDIMGVILSVIGLTLLIYAISFGNEKGWTSGTIQLCFLLSVAAITFFVVWEKSNPAPIFDLSILKHRDFAFANGAALLAVMVLGGSSFLIPFYLQNFMQLQAEEAGFVTLAYSLVYMLLGPFAGRLSDKTHPRYLTSGGMGVALAASLFFVFFLNRSGLLWVTLLYGLLAIAFALFISPNNNLVMGLAPREKLGLSAGIFQTANNLGQTLGISLFETAYSWNVPVSGIPAVYAQAAHQTPHVAMAVGFQRAFLLSAGVCFVSFILSFFINSGRRDRNNAHQQP